MNAVDIIICIIVSQEMVLSIIPSFSNMIDYSAMKNSIIPRIKNLCLQTTTLAVSNCGHCHPPMNSVGLTLKKQDHRVQMMKLFSITHMCHGLQGMVCSS